MFPVTDPGSIINSELRYSVLIPPCHVALGKKNYLQVAGSLLACEVHCGITMLASGNSFIFLIYLWTHLQKWKCNYYRNMAFSVWIRPSKWLNLAMHFRTQIFWPTQINSTFFFMPNDPAFFWNIIVCLLSKSSLFIKRKPEFFF